MGGCALILLLTCNQNSMENLEFRAVEAVKPRRWTNVSVNEKAFTICLIVFGSPLFI